ncbi:MAG: hypothetical protein IJA79_04265 [Desulfovibrio sp.]|nr:hypothetical protein [Desulfovibrio sp.]
MPVLSFSKWSPGGNTTLFLPAADVPSRQQASLASHVLGERFLSAEQAGFVDIAQRRLRMAGGEFCVNASRAFGALLALRECERSPRQALLDGMAQASYGGEAYEHRCEIMVSGWQSPVVLHVHGCAPCWEVTASLRLPLLHPRQSGPGMTLVRLPGISHMLLDATMHPMPEAHQQALEQTMLLLRQTWQLENDVAVGAIWWREVQGQLEMFPLVHVRDPRSICLESACGSGALALALALSQSGGKRRFDILQPSGSLLHVALREEGEERRAEIGGPVHLVARGTVWLPEENA